MSENDAWYEMMLAKTAELFDKFKAGSPEKQQRFLRRIDELIAAKEIGGEPMEGSTVNLLKELKTLLEKEAKAV